LGKVSYVEMCVIAPLTTKAWKRSSMEQGGGRFLDFGSHMIDQLLNLFPHAKVKSVFGDIQFNHEEAPDTDSHTTAVIKLDNGVTG
jgi:predicted dehydrogenase